MHTKPLQTQHLFIIILVIMFVLSCVGSNTGTPTPVQPTNTLCPEIPYNPTAEIKPTFYFVLIDGTLNFTSQRIADSQQALESSLLSLIRTGDRVSIGWINDDTQYYGIEKNLLFTDVFAIEADSIPITPTLPPTLKPFETATVTPTSVGELRQTAVAKTVDTAKQQEQEAVQRAINEYLCQQGKTIVEISEINNLIESLRLQSANLFIQNLSNKFSSNTIQPTANYPFFEVLAEVTNFINFECDLEVYSNCVLIIFSDLNDFRENLDSDKVPYSDMEEKIDIVSVLYQCQFATACETKLNNWTRHFDYFNNRSFIQIFNKDADKDIYNETIANDLINNILFLKNQ